MTAGIFDYLLISVLVVLAWQMLHAKDLFTGIVLYMVFGLLMAVAWIQLNAPDIALVEAAIGSGLIGAFFLGVLGRLEDKSAALNDTEKVTAVSENWKNRLFTGLCVILGTLLAGSILVLPRHSPGLSVKVNEAMAQSGVNNPVTAVILNFRAYDTLLEIGVLLLAALAVGALVRFDLIKPRKVIAASRLLDAFVHIVVPFMILIGGYLLWAGSDLPGGAFQAGAIFSGAGVLALLAGTPIRLDIREIWLRTALAVGFLTFLMVGVLVMTNNRNFLDYPAESAKYLILLIEALATVSITAIFIYLFAVCAGFLRNEPLSGTRAREGSKK